MQGAVPDPFRFVYHSWNNESGLPQNSVFDIEQDKDGYLWGATEDGLFRFDGATFDIINEGNTGQISSDAFYDLLSTPDGLWASGRTSIVRINTVVQQVWDLSSRIKGGWIKCMEYDPDGQLWIGTNTGNLFYLRDDSVYESKQWNAVEISSVESMKYDGKKMLIGTSQGLFSMSSPDESPNQIHYFSGIPISTLLISDNNEIWVGTVNSGLIHISDDTTRFTTNDGLKENYINSLETCMDGTLWIGFRSRGYQIFKNKNFYTPHQDRVANDGVRSIFSVSDKMIWLGTNSSGLVMLKPELISKAPQSAELYDKIILPVYQHTNGEIWVGTAGRGVHRITDKSTTKLGMKDGLSSNLVLSVYGREDFIYLGTSVGLDRYNLKTSKIDRNYSSKNGLSNNSIITLFADSHDRLWISTRLGGLFTMDLQENIQPVKLPSGIHKSTIMAAFSDRAGNTWFGSRGGGMIRIDSSEQIQHISSKQGLPSDIVYAFYQDREGDLWIATEKGLVLYSGGKFRLFDRSSGLFFNEFYRILEDPKGYVWLSGNLGLQRIAVDELLLAKKSTDADYYLAVRLFNAKDGMPNSETNGGFFPAGWAMLDGSLWFPTVQGVAVVDYRKIIREENSLNIHIQSLQFGGRKYFPDEQIVLPPGVFNFEIHYTSIDFSKAGDIQYFFRLRREGEKWTPAGNRHIAYFSELAPGDYIFEVKAERYGVGSPVEEMRFTVEPYFHQTLFFKVLMVIILAMLILAVIWFQKRRAQGRIREQQIVMRAQINGQEKERQFISTELHDSISQQLATARMFLDMAKTPNSRQIDFIDKSEEVVKNVINDIRALCHSLTPPGLKDIGLKEALEELFRSYSSIGKFTIDFQISIDPDKIEEDLQFMLFRIIQEQMQNIARHSEAKNVCVDFSTNAGTLIISIRDDGKGFDPKSVKYGIGFRNIRNRLVLYNGKMEIKSAEGRGCALLLAIPNIIE